jgi:hydrogenase/urease accessory protein HupE
MKARAVAFVAMFLALCGSALAHDVRPGYLSLTEREDGRFDVLFKVPASGETQMALEARLPPACRDTAPQHDLEGVGGATVERWTIDCAAGGLESGEISIAGLELTLTDVLLRVEWRDGTRFSTVLRPEANVVRPARKDAGKATVPAAGFLRLGIEHILGGVDHLLFVLCLVLLVDGARRLFFTITAFTLAHSVTLALATLGVVHVPSRPVEASIALSIVLLAVELVRQWRGEDSLTIRKPWLVSFAFGLLHGLGFAGALSQVGLPQGDIPLALFLFNVGVEVGQVAFVSTVLTLLAGGGALLRRFSWKLPRWAPLLPAYAIGCVAAAWLLQRAAAML